MCGICGAVAVDGTLDPAIALSLRRMTDVIAHRGPDGEGHFVSERAVLGHRRLAIIDRAAGEQPMANEDGSCTIVFNGEIYNHHDLRRELVAKGHVFRTHCDTEAIVHAYEEFGPACVERLEGMFAFAIYDARDHSVFMARDRLGKKPLFFAVLGGALHFASEIQAIAQSPHWHDALNLDALEGYLSLGYFLAPNTAYRHVHSLEPAQWLRLSNGRLEARTYWDITDVDSDHRDDQALVEELDQLLGQAVTTRLESEVPLGAFLSGGIDSGLVASFMTQASTHAVVTTSVGFDDGEHNELGAAALTARHLKTSHFAETAAVDFGETLARVVRGFDQPFADSSVVPTYYVSGMAKKRVTVALSGDGGDEAFGGYDFRYVPHALEAKARAFVPGAGGRMLAGALGQMWPTHPRLPRALRLASIFQNLGRDSAAAYYADLCFMKPAATRRLLGQAPSSRLEDSPVFDAVTAPYRRCPSRSAVQRAQYADLKVYLPNDVLVKVDRMSMLHSLEVRCPLLDRRVIEFAFRVPTERKMPNLRAKHLLKTLAATRLPRQLLDLPKKGFTAPVAAWLRTTGRVQFSEEVLSAASKTRDFVDQSEVRRRFDAHLAGARDHAYDLWAVWMLERWLRLQSAAKPRAGVGGAWIASG